MISRIVTMDLPPLIRVNESKPRAAASDYRQESCGQSSARTRPARWRRNAYHDESHVRHVDEAGYSPGVPFAGGYREDRGYNWFGGS